MARSGGSTPVGPDVGAEFSIDRLFDLALDLLCVADTDAYFHRVNPAFCHRLGWTEEELLRTPFLDLVHPDDVESTLVAIERLSQHKAVLDFMNRYRCADGSYRWLSWRSMPSEDGRLIYASARDVTDELEARTIAEERAGIIDRQSRDLARAANVHQTLAQAMADGAELPDILAKVSSLTDKPAGLLSPSLSIVRVAWPGDGGEHMFWSPDAANVQVGRLLRALSESQPSVIVPPMPDRGLIVRHLVSRLAVRGEVIGYLAVSETGGPFTSFDGQVVEHSSALVALSLVSQQRQLQAEGQAREELLLDLLQGSREPQLLVKRACSHGLNLGQPHLLVRVNLRDGSRISITGAARRNLLCRRLSEQLQVRMVLAVGVPGADIFLVPVPEGKGRDPLERVRAAVKRALAGAGLFEHIHGVLISGVCTDAEEYARVHRELRLIMASMGTRLGDDPVVLARDLGLMQVMVSPDSAESAEKFAHDLLGPLLEPSSAGESLLETLRAFLEAGGQCRQAATRLGVHENTVRYRLGRITKLTGIDVDDLGSLLDARFALQVLSLLDPSRRRRSPDPS